MGELLLELFIDLIEMAIESACGGRRKKRRRETVAGAKEYRDFPGL